MSELNVLSVASEIFPLIKTGGLADVAGALPGALAREGVEVRTLVPGYPAVMAKLAAASTAREYADLFGGPARVIAGGRAGSICSRSMRPISTTGPAIPTSAQTVSTGPTMRDASRRSARVGADIGSGEIDAFKPEVVHAHDWQAALAPAYLHYAGGPRPGHGDHRSTTSPSRATIPPALFGELGLPDPRSRIDGVEYFGGVGFLKAGLLLADRITTVSPTYAREIMTPEFGMALDGLLRTRAAVVQGIVNGIDDTVWNPATDTALPQNYSALRIDMRVRNKTALQAQMGMAPGVNRPLFGVVSRLSDQKGLDLLLQALPASSPRAAQLALLGSGDRALETGFAAAAAARPDSVACVLGYDERLAHLFQAGADFIVVPSRFEPCGLTQLCALRYGAPPIVARVGGLADTVIDANESARAAGVATGVQFCPPSVDALSYALDRAFEIGHDPATSRRMRLNGMRSDVSWRGPAQRYAALYRALAEAGANERASGWPRGRRHGEIPRGGARPAQCRARFLCVYDGDREFSRADGARRAWRPPRRGGRLRSRRPLRLPRRGALRSGAGRPLRRFETTGRSLRLAVRPAVPHPSVDVCAWRRQRPLRAQGHRGSAARGRAGPQRIAPEALVIYELNLRGFSRLNPAIPEAQRGDLRRARPSGLDRPSRQARRHRSRDHAGRRIRRRTASAAARPLERVGL